MECGKKMSSGAAADRDLDLDLGAALDLALDGGPDLALKAI